MAFYEVESHELKPIEGDNQIELIITAADGSRWEYGIPYTPGTTRYMFEEIDVIEMDFGEEFRDRLVEELDALVAKLNA